MGLHIYIVEFFFKKKQDLMQYLEKFFIVAEVSISNILYN